MVERKVIYNGTIKQLKGKIVTVIGETSKMYRYKVYIRDLNPQEHSYLRYNSHMLRGRDNNGMEFFKGSVTKVKTSWVDNLPDAMFIL